MKENVSKLQHSAVRVVVNGGCLIGCLFVFFSCWLYQILPAQAEAFTPPKTCQLGVYLTSLRDFEPADKSFTANFWVWSVCPFETPKPLKSLKMINSKEISINYTSSSQSENLLDTFKANKTVFRSEQEISAIFYHNWDTRNYPFDRHTLQIPLEEANLDASSFVHSPDFASSDYQKEMDLEGWEITNFKIAQMNFPYGTRFGKLGGKREPSYRSRLTTSITINRRSKVSFFKLSTGVYAAVALSILSLLLAEEFGGRMAIFVGNLFAVLVNMQTATSDLGSTNSVTLIDFIHIIAIIYIFIAAILVIYDQFMNESGRGKSSLRSVRRLGVPILSGSFIILNIVIISYAVIVG